MVANNNQMEYIRLVTPGDSSKLCSIYSYYVEQTAVSFEYLAPDVSEFEHRIRAFSKTCPYLVYCKGTEILGYAYAHPAFQRAAYAWCAETTAYVDHCAKGKGIGSALYSALIRILALQGYKILYAVIVAENTESCLFHQQNGFRLTATFPNAGYKFNRWLDVVWYERVLGEFQEPIGPPVAFEQLSMEEVEKICEEVNATLKPISNRSD